MKRNIAICPHCKAVIDPRESRKEIIINILKNKESLIIPETAKALNLSTAAVTGYLNDLVRENKINVCRIALESRAVNKIFFIGKMNKNRMAKIMQEYNIF